MVKVTINEKGNGLRFPKYMISQNKKILIYALKVHELNETSLIGVCIYDNTGHNEKGEYAKNWDAEVFTDFRGTFKVEQ